jgi:hypothetical protein
MHAQLVLAHYGGVPEALTIALPLLSFVGFLLLEKRTRRRERERAQAAPADQDGQPTEPEGSA